MVKIEHAFALLAVATALVAQSFPEELFKAMFYFIGGTLVFCTVASGLSRIWLKIPAKDAFLAAFASISLGMGMTAIALAILGIASQYLVFGAVARFTIACALAFATPAASLYIFLRAMNDAGANARTPHLTIIFLASVVMAAYLITAGYLAAFPQTGCQYCGVLNAE